MHTHSDKSPEHKSKSAANRWSKNEHSRASAFQFSDDRLEADAQRKFQTTIRHVPGNSCFTDHSIAVALVERQRTIEKEEPAIHLWARPRSYTI